MTRYKTQEQVERQREMCRNFHRKRRERMAADPVYAESERVKRRGWRKAERDRANALRPPKIRPVRIEGDLAFIPLSQGREAVIDAADVHLVASRNWHARSRDGIWYALSNERLPGGRRVLLSLHRVILGDIDKPVIDHADGDGLNNRRSNLRPATYQQNAVNSKPNSNSRTGFKGVAPTKSGRWTAQIRVDGRAKYLGTFGSPDEAACAYDAEAIRIHGEFARLNFPQGETP